MADIIEQKPKTLLTGFQPTGIITLGNYLGAVQNCVKLQKEYNSKKSNFSNETIKEE